MTVASSPRRSWARRSRRKIYRVGLIFTTSPVSVMAGPEPVHPLFSFGQSLRALGYVEGQNLILERIEFGKSYA
jgi:hypothetical protein